MKLQMQTLGVPFVSETPSALLLTAALLLCVTGCGRSAGPTADGEEVKRIAGIFAKDVIVKPEPPVEATGTATIKGVFRLAAGDAIPSPRLLNARVREARNDLAVCMPGGKDVPSKALVISQNRGIAMVNIKG